MANNVLAGYTFIRMSRPPDRRKNITFEAYNGVDDFTVWYDATRGDAIQIETLSVFDSFVNADAACAAYEALQGTGPHDLTYENDPRTFRVIIQRVFATPKAIILGIGGNVDPARAQVRAIWQVVAWPAAP